MKTDGVVQWIDNNNGSKAGQLLDILQKRSQSIVIVTIQSFSFLLSKIHDADFNERNFAIIIDEAHSSTSGRSATHLKKAVFLHDGYDDDDPEMSLDDIISEQMEKQKDPDRDKEEIKKS